MSIAEGVLLLWSLPVIVMDLHSRRVRWWWSLAGLFTAVVFRALSWFTPGFDLAEMLLIVFAAVGSWQLWRAGIWGGADAKTAITLAFFMPAPVFFLFSGGLIILTSGAVLLWRRWRRPVTTQWRPGRRLTKGGYPMAAMLCLSILLFAVLRGNCLF
ncbi:MAG: prepilin peptidase [Anaerolineales bacterium]|nr:prepilin peptidase [Anaerolineales bacterium]